jgi:predicted amidohydrolase
MRMRAALVVDRVRATVGGNLAAVEAACASAAARGAGLVLFPEAALTGLINNDDPEHDLRLGRSLTGPDVARIAGAARRAGCHVAFGLLEREGTSLYDSAVLIDSAGEVALHYRRMQTQWHGPTADPSVYRQGDAQRVAETPFGRVGFLICGDLFDDGVVGRLRGVGPALVLVPMSRSFTGGGFDQARWDREEEAAYVARAAMLGCTVLIVNQLESEASTQSPAFGGAWVIGPRGDVLARRPLGEVGALVVDV